MLADPSAEALQNEDSAEYARSLGITDAYVDGIARAVADGQLERAQVAGFTAAELDALYWQGMDLVRRRAYGDAGNVFLFLAFMDRTDMRYLRGLALVFHCLHEFGWSNGVCDMALALVPDDRITLVLKAEATLYFEGKRAAHKRLSHVLTLSARDSDEQLYLDRAKQILAKIRL
jgi:hypothetical protein